MSRSKKDPMVAQVIDRLIRLLGARDVKQLAFEVKMGWPRGRISKWKNGQGELHVSHLKQICDELVVDPSYFLADEAQEPAFPRRDEFAPAIELMRYLGFPESMRRLTLSAPQGEAEGPDYAIGRSYGPGGPSSGSAGGPVGFPPGRGNRKAK